MGIPFDFNGNGDVDFWEDGGGGGIVVQSNMSLVDCVFTENTAGDGAGLSLYQSSPEITGCEFMSNLALGGGGAIEGFQSSSPNVTSCSFISNQAGVPPIQGRGGAMYFQDGCRPTIEDSSFEFNEAVTGGGAFFSSDSDAQIKDCLFTGNTASSWAGGVYATAGSDVILDSCDFSFNDPHSFTEDSSAIATIKDCLFLQCCDIIVYGYIDGGGNEYDGNSYFTCDSCRADVNCQDGVDSGDLGSHCGVGNEQSSV